MQKIAFKGTVHGIILQFDPTMPFEVLYKACEEKLIEANGFFKGSHIIGVEAGEFTLEQEQQLMRLFQSAGGMKVLSLERVERIKKRPQTAPPEPLAERTEQSVQPAQHTAPSAPQAEAHPQEAPPAPPIMEFGDYEPVLMHRGTLRSGSRLKSDGHIVLLGDANPGSELVAKGNIVVLGALRGIAHAGSGGDEDSFIFAMRLEPTQLRIANNITRPPDEDKEGRNYAEIVTIKEQQFVIKPYK